MTRYTIYVRMPVIASDDTAIRAACLKVWKELQGRFDVPIGDGEGTYVIPNLPMDGTRICEFLSFVREDIP